MWRCCVGDLANSLRSNIHQIASQKRRYGAPVEDAAMQWFYSNPRPWRPTSYQRRSMNQREQLLNKVAPSVVNVSVTDKVDGEYVTNSNGSGVIVNADGIIFTAFDLVANYINRQSTTEGKITVGLHGNRTIAANLVAANKGIGLAVLKVNSERQLKAALVGKSNDHRPFLNVEWPPTLENSLMGYRRLDTLGGTILMHHKCFANSYHINKEHFGGPIINSHGHVVAISQKKPLFEEIGFIAATPVEEASKMGLEFVWVDSVRNDYRDVYLVSYNTRWLTSSVYCASTSSG